jgi:hypothetical protein
MIRELFETADSDRLLAVGDPLPETNHSQSIVERVTR